MSARISPCTWPHLSPPNLPTFLCLPTLRLPTQNLSTLSKLRILSIQSNRLTKLEGLSSLSSLEELYLSHNGLEKLEGLEGNTKLRVLDIGANRIKKVEGVRHLKEMEEFWVSGNGRKRRDEQRASCRSRTDCPNHLADHNLTLTLTVGTDRPTTTCCQTCTSSLRN